MLQAGQQLAHFKIIRLLGEGGMGQVFLAEDEKLNRRVALKVLHSEFVNDSDRMSRFVREARTAAQISHPNVMAIYDLDTAAPEGASQTVNYIVLEYVDGQPVIDYLQAHSPRIGELLRLAQKIASGLAAAHKLKIVHRDIKSENILIDAQGEPKILDFGLAKPVESLFASGDKDSTNTLSGELTQEGKILGTVSYMSPEQARGEAVDGRSDVFSFGILLYRMFAGKSPFEGPDRVSVVAKILETKPVPLRQLNGAAPAELERIVEKCLEKDPNDRYQDTRDLVVDLRSLRRQYDSGISDSTSVSTELPAVRKRFSLSGWKLWVGAAAAIVAVGGTWLLTRDEERSEVTKDKVSMAVDIASKVSEQLAKAGIDVNLSALNIPGVAARKNALAILEFENKTGDPELDWLSSGLPEILLTDLAQGGGANIIGRNRVLDYLGRGASGAAPSHADCVEAARALGASRALSGSYFKMADKVRIDARLEDTETGRIIMAEKVIGKDPFALVDSLTQKVAQAIDVSGLGGENREVASITSASPEAYKHYILGMEKFGVSQVDEARADFEKAIAIDSTFALPYMRIGMSYAMRGRGQQGAPYFAKAMHYQDRLPLKDRLLLDIYADLWLRTEFDDAMIKIESYVQNYPDDKEGRAFYAILQNTLRRDPVGALAQLDTVLMLDPTYFWALEFSEQIHRMKKELDKAIAVDQRIKTLYPKNPTPYDNLASIYLDQGLLNEATNECRQLLAIYPDNASGLQTLINIYLLQRNFPEVEKCVEQLGQYHKDDPVLLMSCSRTRANLDFWQGKFRSGLKHLHEALQQALKANDSVQISNTYSSLSEFCRIFGIQDSILYYSKLSYQWATQFQTFNYPMDLIRTDPSHKAEARALFAQATDNFKSRIPKELWGIVNTLQTIFEAYGDNDTASIITGLQQMLSDPVQENSSDMSELGILMVRTGRFQEGKDVLTRVLSGDLQTTLAPQYLLSRYYYGVAQEGLGSTSGAVDAYHEVLQYWSNPDINLLEIQDLRARLSRLSS